MKSQSTVVLLNDSVYTIVQNKNEGYPIHKNSLLESEEVPEEAPKVITLTDKSTYVLENGYVKGINAGTSLETIRSNISNKEGIIISTPGTGGLITLTINGNVTDSAIIIVRGDVDGDGLIDSTDYLRIKSEFLGLLTFDEPSYLAADVDGDGRLTALDAAYILQKSAGIIEGEFPGSGAEWIFDGTMVVNLTGDKSNMNFTGILLGDVTGDWTPVSEEMD
jgi:hypothetical protein